VAAAIAAAVAGIGTGTGAAETASPSVTVTAPAQGATVSGKVPFTADVAGGTPIWVAMTADGGSLWAELRAPYEYNGDTDGKFDTSALPDGPHVFAARAYFADGTSAAGSVTVNVANTRPSATLSITSPAQGATVSGRVPFTASLANGTATRVELTIDGGAPWTELVPPYVYKGDGNTVDSTTLSNGMHTFAAKAFLTDGTTVTASVTADVENVAAPAAPPPPPPPPPPAPTSSPLAHDGTGITRFGDTFGTAGGYDRYDYVIVGYGDVDKAAALPGRTLVYKGGVDVFSSSNSDPGLNSGGVPYSQAAANGWLLKDSSGNVVHADGFGNYLGDVGDPGFQQAWATNVANFLLAHHADGVFIDNVICSITGLSGGVVPAKYPTDGSFANAYVSFLSFVGPYLKARGLYVATNTFCFGAADMSANVNWWTRVAPYVDGLMNEVFEQNPNDYSVRYFDAPQTSWLGNWAANLKLIQTAQNAGRDAFALTFGSAGNTSMMAYARASYLLAWNGKGGSFMWTPTDAADPWNRAWTADIGIPLAPMARVGTAYVRDYSKGFVVVNPGLGPTSVNLPLGLKTLTGLLAGLVANLAPQTAVVFTK
jgi:hypothetical protein